MRDAQRGLGGAARRAAGAGLPLRDASRRRQILLRRPHAQDRRARHGSPSATVSNSLSLSLSLSIDRRRTCVLGGGAGLRSVDLHLRRRRRALPAQPARTAAALHRSRHRRARRLNSTGIRVRIQGTFGVRERGETGVWASNDGECSGDPAVNRSTSTLERIVSYPNWILETYRTSRERNANRYCG